MGWLWRTLHQHWHSHPSDTSSSEFKEIPESCLDRLGAGRLTRRKRPTPQLIRNWFKRYNGGGHQCLYTSICVHEANTWMKLDECDILHVAVGWQHTQFSDDVRHGAMSSGHGSQRWTVDKTLSHLAAHCVIALTSCIYIQCHINLFYLRRRWVCVCVCVCVIANKCLRVHWHLALTLL